MIPSLTIRVGVLLLAWGTTPWLWAEPGAVAELQKEIAAKTGLARRQAARKLMELGPEATPAIVALTKDQDVVIRRNAVRLLRRLLGVEAVALYREALQDPSPLVRIVAVEELRAYQPRTGEVTGALLQAAQDADNEVRKLAAGAFWSFHRDYVPLRRRPNWDHAIEVIARQSLPTVGWRFRTDPGRAGHVQKWFAPQVDEAGWHEIAVGQWWHDALPEKVGQFEGIAWYRIEFTAPDKPQGEFHEAVLRFEAVDESAWVWVNGQYAGEHDLGTAGWNVPFDIEVGSFLRWGQSNQITVRVLNAAGAGGIYKPVEFQVLK
ncbi:MAG: hypothetical protein GX575_14115 [Candidatus Anammoximicrobium sp.]|nr:hypothetical protein [Candidatus Anammoximicrobium sp.]